MAEIEPKSAPKTSRRKKALIIIGVVVLIAAAAGAGVALRWWQNSGNGDQEDFTAPTLSSDATELQDLRSEGNEEEFNEKIAEILADPSLDDETRYQVLLQQGHNFVDQNELQGATEAYLEAEQLQETHEVTELLAETYYQAGDIAKTIEYYQKASGLIPDDNPRKGVLQELYADYVNRLENDGQLEEEQEE